MRPTALAAFVALTNFLLGQTTWYVSASAPPGGNGSAGAPFQAIQAGVDAAAPSDTVLVAPGTYVGSVTINAKDITLRSTEGPNVTLTGFVNGCGLTIMSTSSSCLIEGLTITDCTGTDYTCGSPSPSYSTPGGLYIQNASPVVRRCVIKNNSGGQGWPLRQRLRLGPG